WHASYPAAPGRPTFTTENVYNVNGYLSEVKDTSESGWSIWKATSMDAEGHLTGDVINTGTVTGAYTFDKGTGQLTHVVTKTSGTTQQDSSYACWTNGNLLSRTDALQNRTETFGYDALNRLKSSSISGGGPSTTWSYDSNGTSALGNLTSTSE